MRLILTSLCPNQGARQRQRSLAILAIAALALTGCGASRDYPVLQPMDDLLAQADAPFSVTPP